MQRMSRHRISRVLLRSWRPDHERLQYITQSDTGAVTGAIDREMACFRSLLLVTVTAGRFNDNSGHFLVTNFEGLSR